MSPSARKPASDRTLVIRARKGDEDAQSELYRRYEIPVRDLIMARVKDWHLTNDLTQDTFIRFFRTLIGFNPDLPITPWLVVIANNIIKDYRRRNRIKTVPIRGHSAMDTGRLKGAIQVRSTELTPSTRAVWTEEQERITAAAKLIRPTYGACFIQRDIMELEYPEIAKHLKMEIGTVREYVRRARTMVKEVMDKGLV